MNSFDYYNISLGLIVGGSLTYFVYFANKTTKKINKKYEVIEKRKKQRIQNLEILSSVVLDEIKKLDEDKLLAKKLVDVLDVELVDGPIKREGFIEYKYKVGEKTYTHRQEDLKSNYLFKLNLKSKEISSFFERQIAQYGWEKISSTL